MKIFYLITLTCVCQNIRQVNSVAALTGALQGSDPYEEGTNVEIILTAGGLGEVCNIKTDNADYSPVGTNPISLANNQVKTATVSLVSDAQTEGTESVNIEILCGISGPQSFTIQVIEPPGGNGDPHFMLLVQDENDKKGIKKHICFDVTSTKGNKIKIFHDKQENITIYGLLKDDYYMHELQFHIDEQYFQVRPTQILWQGANIVEWNDQSFQFVEKQNDITLNIERNLLFVKVARNEDTLKKHSFLVKKSMNPLIGNYLDVYINNLHSYKSASGLLGYAMNQSYKFFASSQNSRRMALKINEKIYPSEITSRGNIDCWLLNVNHVLYPKSLDHFISNY